MGAVNLDKMVEKNRDLLECERCQIFGNVRGEGGEKMRCRDRAEEIGQGPFSTGSSDEPVLKVQLWPHLRLKIGLKPFRTGS
jgi:hypothetical protein